MNEIKVLLVDDDEDDYLLTSDYIRDIPDKSFIVHWASNFSDALPKILERQYDIYFFDFLLGAKTGLELIKEAVKAGCEEPIILLTGKGDQRIDREAMELGAVDYLIKGELDSEKLERTIRYALDRSANLKALKTSEERYRSLFEQSKDMIFISNPEGRFVYLNSSATDLLGFTREEFMQLYTTDLYEDQSEREYLIEILHENGEIQDYEITLRTKNGEKRICILSASLQEKHNGEVFFQGIIHDITSRKKAEQEALQIEKFNAAGRLLRTLAHEVRNPLTNINLSVEQLQSELEDEGQVMFLDIVKRNSKRINDLITELLNSLRPTQMSLQQVSIHEVLDQTIAESQDRAKLRNIEIITNFQEEDILLWLDIPKIKIAFTNIIVNALEAMEENTGKLIISTESGEKRAKVCFEDNGSGIIPENLKRLFEPYFTSKSQGMGLGLAATLNIIQSHQASAEVESAVGKGTNFSVTFPLHLNT